MVEQFKIIQFTDLHLGPHHDDKDQQTFQLIKQITETYNPDLLIFTGDQIWSEGIVDAYKTYKRLIDFLNQFNTRLAFTYGNHDSESNYDRSLLRSIEKQTEFLTEKFESKVINDKEAYVIPVDMENAKYLLYVIDTGSTDRTHYGLYDFVEPGHNVWLSDVQRKYKGYNNNLLFTHIPLPEYNAVIEARQIKGGKNETIGSPLLNTGTYAHILLNGDIKNVFAGHDHDNDFSFNLNGVSLHYGRVSGFNCYGDLCRGAREIVLNDNGLVETRIIEYDSTL